MLSFNTHPEDIQEMKNIINNGKFHSITFIKADNSIRFANGKKLIYKASETDNNAGRWNREDANIITIFDNNKPKLGADYKPLVNPETGKVIMGAPISVRLDRLLFFKSGSFFRDFTEENSDAIIKAGITAEQIDEIRKKIKLQNIIQEEILRLSNNTPKFTEEDLDNCWQYYKSYLVDILNGDYDLEEAREDLRGLIGGKFDKRVKNIR